MLKELPGTDAITLANWLGGQDIDAALVDVTGKLASACCEIALQIRSAPLAGATGGAGTVNVQGEAQAQLDVIADRLVIEALTGNPHIAAMVSEEVDEIIQNPAADGNYVVCFDPLDGSSNIEINGIIGTIFSVLELGERAGPVDDAAVLGAAARQVTAGYVLYGPVTMLVLTTGKSVAMFALNPAGNTFLLVKDHVMIAEEASEFAINMAHRRFWDGAVTTYIDDCLRGEEGPRSKPFNMRWAGAMVADVHRLFVRGGIFIYPALDTPGGASGKLRYLYEANPMAMLVEAAGGLAMSGDQPHGDVVPKTIHQRVPVALGSKQEVMQLAKGYLRDT